MLFTHHLPLLCLFPFIGLGVTRVNPSVMAEFFSSRNREVVGICGMSMSLERWWEGDASDVRDWMIQKGPGGPSVGPDT